MTAVTALGATAAKVAAEPSTNWGLGIGAPVFVLSLTMVWAGLHLRGRTHARLRRPVDLAFEGLAEQAVTHLRKLRDELDAIVPHASTSFDPKNFILDPSQVEDTATRGISVLKERSKLVRRFELLLSTCSCMKSVTVAFSIVVLSSTVLYFVAYESRWIWRASCLLGIALAVVGTLFAICYALLDGRIQKSIEMADPVDVPNPVSSI
jgi:hypothetical protein